MGVPTVQGRRSLIPKGKLTPDQRRMPSAWWEQGLVGTGDTLPPPLWSDSWVTAPAPSWRSADNSRQPPPPGGEGKRAQRAPVRVNAPGGRHWAQGRGQRRRARRSPHFPSPTLAPSTPSGPTPTSTDHPAPNP